MAVKRKGIASTQDLELADPLGKAPVDAGATPNPYVVPNPDPVPPSPVPPAVVPSYVEGDYPNGQGPNGPNPTTPTPAPTSPVARNYNPIAGWEQSKLNDPSVRDTKYDFGRAAQDYTGTYGRGNIGGLIDYYNSLYGGHARATSDDHVDFGESYGPIDIFNANGDYLQWVVDGGGDQASAPTPSASAPGASPASAFAGGGAAGPSYLSQAIAQLPNRPGPADNNYNPPGTAGVFDSTALQQVGQDPFSSLLTNSYADLINYQRQQLNTPPPTPPPAPRVNRAAAIEAARMPYEIARRSQLANARGDLANRGLLSEPGHLQGPEVSSIQRIEEGLAPAYTGAIADRLGAQDQLGLQQDQLAFQREQQQQQVRQQQEQSLLDTLTGGTSRQNALAQIALANLDQNRAWSQFLMQYGLDADKVRYDMEHGNVDQYLHLLELWLQGAQISANGFI